MVSVKLTTLPSPTFLSVKVPVADTVTTSPVTKPVKVALETSVVAAVLPS